MVIPPNTLRFALTALTALALTGCPCDSGHMDLFADPLRDDCDGLPCGWQLSAGEARFVPFLHEGEGALELAGTLGRTLSDFNLSSPVEGDVQVFLLARCDQATELLVTLESDADPPHDYVATLAAGTPTGGLPLPRHELPLVRSDTNPDEPAAGVLVPFRSIELRVEGPGRCTVSDLHLTSTGSSGCF